MANLRDLVSYTDQQQIAAFQTAGISTVPATPISFPGSEYNQIQFRTHCAVNRFRHFECYVWKPPVGTTFIKFEIWGGGGGGPGTCCCMWGTPGGSGAYAYKCICTGFDLGGSVYEICVASASCCSPINTGARGCKSFVVGPGLRNFCAEGGYGGQSFCANCNGSWEMFCLCDYTQACAEGASMPYGAAICCDMCTGHWGNCGFSCFTPGGGIGMYPIEYQDVTETQYDLIGAGTTFGSNCRRVHYGHALNPCYGGLCWSMCAYCAPYFGADGGAIGLPGLMGSPCNHAMDWCMITQYHPYPGGLINTRGGYLPYRYTSMNLAGENGAHYRFQDYFGHSSNRADEGIVGLGGRSASSESGNCYCGGPGHAGMVRITYG
jgi:hypothetical protein